MVRHSLLIALHAPDFISPKSTATHTRNIYTNTCVQYMNMNTYKQTDTSKQKLQLHKNNTLALNITKSTAADTHTRNIHEHMHANIHEYT